MKHVRRRRAQALVWFVVVLPLFLSVIGLAIDGEAVLRAHRRAQGAADGAARTGVGHVQTPRRHRSASSMRRAADETT